MTRPACQRLLVLVVSGILMTVMSPAEAGGPLLIFDPAARAPFHYPPGTVEVFSDLGPNGVLSNEESDTLLARALTEWSGVSSSYFSATIAGEILVGGVPTDITLANVDSIITTGTPRFNGGGIHVIYDTDGTILSGFFGAPPGVAGVASPEFSDTNSPDLLESWVVLNGSLVDPGDTSPIPGATFAGVFTHEFGHAINLAHTQTNGGIIFYGDDLGATGCASLGGTPTVFHTETMYPFIDINPGSTGEFQATVTHPDDITAISNLCPAASWPTSSGTITGTIRLPDNSEITGANVIARNLADPLGDAVSALSGDHTQGDLGPDGLYTLNGLTPGASYVVYVDAIVDGSFSTPPTNLVFLEEYWNGANESGDVLADTACSFVPVVAVAGVPAAADIVLNIDPDVLPLSNTDPIQIPLPFPFPFCESVYDSVWVDPDGFLTFGARDLSTSITATVLLGGPPRITGFWTDLAPANGGTVTAREVGGNFEVSFDQVPELLGIPNTFKITLRPDGTHRVDFGSVDALLGLVGRSPGVGAPDPGGTDLSGAPQPLGTGQGNETVYEEFGLFTPIDLSNMSLEFDPCGTVVGVEKPAVPPAAALLQSRPNPFRTSTVIGFDLPQPGPVALRIFDVAGRLVRTLVDRELTSGSHTAFWDGRTDHGAHAPPGLYLYCLKTSTFQAAQKVLRVR